MDPEEGQYLIKKGFPLVSEQNKIDWCQAAKTDVIVEKKCIFANLSFQKASIMR